MCGVRRYKEAAGCEIRKLGAERALVYIMLLIGTFLAAPTAARDCAPRAVIARLQRQFPALKRCSVGRTVSRWLCRGVVYVLLDLDPDPASRLAISAPQRLQQTIYAVGGLVTE